MLTAEQAIRTHGALAVYTAAHRHMSGDRKRGLPSVGVYPVTMGDVWRAMSAAYAEMGSAAQAIDAAQSSAALEKL
ncbi:hypothetical protein QRO08_16560 [Paracidovorax citrulli]|uniref:Uncharacterized protein n=2 Tax=Paracidovorax citrulli TaxID=80869 RepID=A1TMN9_PARC0|nr:hypothetical protein [Paracidovorax citrulli]ABM32227.1 hypothetical protein Aave_1640 [Paracidovorax citrulli AAC00-1]ATG94755.1 hypothetical protein CQB05_12560 [Paracidovorax citrulli]MVT38516.1 hypothetical protein [Paracidovorax citrulli]PVY66422.1 hypothetical protein C8E08_3829 [Paracidovorax citrulli]REG69408.1 hypothetical protein C8E07_2558 [Paracidovorax citrulli]